MNVKLWIRCIVLFLLLLGIVAVAAFLLFFYSLQLMNTSVTAESYSHLDKYKIEMESRLREIDAVFCQISESENIRNISKLDNPLVIPENDSDFKVMYDVLRSYSQANDFIDDLLLYYPKSGVVYTSNQLFYDMDQCYGSYYTCDGYSQDEWVDELLSSDQRRVYPGQTTTIDSVRASRVLFVEAIASGANMAPAAVVVISVRETSFIAPLADMIQPYDGYGCMLWNGAVIAATNSGEMPHEQADCEDCLSIELFSEYSGWRYVFTLSTQALQGNVSRLRRDGLILLNLSILISLLVFVRLLSGQISTLSKILHRFHVEELPGPVNELVFIHDSINNLFDANDDLQQKLAGFHSVLVNDFWGSLLCGQLVTLEEAQYYLMQLDSIKIEERYITVIMQIHGIDDMNLPIAENLNKMKIYLDKQLRQSFPEYVYGCNLGPLTLVMICTEPLCHQDSSTRLKEIAASFKELFHYTFIYATGSVVENVMEVFASFSDAMSQVRGQFFPHLSVSDNITSYPLTIIHMATLVRLLKLGKDKEVAAYLEQIFDKCFLKGRSPEWKRMQYSHALLSSFLLAYNDIRHIPSFPHQEFAEKIEAAYRCTNIDEQLEQAKDIQHLFSQGVMRENEGTGSTLLDRVIPFIHNHLYDYNLSLEMVADHFHISKTYLSGHFKERMGENFSGYVEKLRIEASCNLIRNGQRKVHEAAKEVGYGSAQAFRRAFKRQMGVSPTEYIETHE